MLYTTVAVLWLRCSVYVCFALHHETKLAAIQNSQAPMLCIAFAVLWLQRGGRVHNTHIVSI